MGLSIFIKFPGDTDAVGPGTTLWNPTHALYHIVWTISFIYLLSILTAAGLIWTLTDLEPGETLNM